VHLRRTNASHELCTPLTLDRTLLPVALRNPQATIEQWRSFAQELLASGQQQERILEAVLTATTSQAGTSRHEPVDLSEVTTVRLRTARAHIQRRRLHLQTALSPPVRRPRPDRAADRQPLGQRDPAQHSSRHHRHHHRCQQRPRRPGGSRPGGGLHIQVSFPASQTKPHQTLDERSQRRKQTRECRIEARSRPAF